MENYQEALAALFLMTGLVVVIFIIARYTYLIKKAMIEKGLAAQQRDRKPQYIDIGCIVIGLGLGLLTSSAFTFFGPARGHNGFTGVGNHLHIWRPEHCSSTLYPKKNWALKSAEKGITSLLPKSRKATRSPFGCWSRNIKMYLFLSRLQ